MGSPTFVDEYDNHGCYAFLVRSETPLLLECYVHPARYSGKHAC